MKTTRPIIKVCGMKDSTNILGLSRILPDYMGFIFYENSKRDVTNTELDLHCIADSIKKTAVFVDQDFEKALKTLNRYKFDAVQLHGNENSEYCKDLRDIGFEVLKAFSIDESFDFQLLEEYDDCVDLFVFDTQIKGQKGGTGKQFDWRLTEKYLGQTPFLLSGGIGPDSMDMLKKFMHPMWAGVDLNSKFEILPAVKDLEQLEEFITNFRKLKL